MSGIMQTCPWCKSRNVRLVTEHSTGETRCTVCMNIERPAPVATPHEYPKVCGCGHVQRIHNENGCRGVYSDFCRAGLDCTCKAFVLREAPVATPPTATPDTGEAPSVDLFANELSAYGRQMYDRGELGEVLERIPAYDNLIKLFRSRPAAPTTPPPTATLGEPTGCGDNSCAIARPKGMGTNGGCRCPDWKLKGVLTRLRSDVERLEADALTPEEAALVLMRFKDFGCPQAVALMTRGETSDGWDEVLKLRRIAARASERGQ